jgi:hypothetical protein
MSEIMKADGWESGFCEQLCKQFVEIACIHDASVQSGKDIPFFLPLRTILALHLQLPCAMLVQLFHDESRQLNFSVSPCRLRFGDHIAIMGNVVERSTNMQAVILQIDVGPS